MEAWYIEQIANTTDDPNILRNIIERGNNDWISQCAAQNKNCPSELLRMILEREKDDHVSHCASKNKNCPLNY